VKQVDEKWIEQSIISPEHNTKSSYYITNKKNLCDMATNAAVKYERLLGFHEINFILAFGPRNMIILFLIS
jgi:hypothetical protein